MPEITPEPTQVVESGKRLEQSMLWELQRRFYSRQGIGAWAESGVPSYVTSNPFIASAYARVIHAWLCDLRAAGETRPAHIIELGAGHGRFGYLCASHLRRRVQASFAPCVPFRYVMTDLVEDNIAFWLQHRQLLPLVKEGLLQFGRLDMEKDEPVSLVGPEEGLTVPAGPLVVVANYLFDTVPTDVYRVREGQLSEGRAILRAPPGFDPHGPGAIEQVALSFDYQPVEGWGHYGEPDLDLVLEEYRRELGNCSFTFPSVSLRGLRRFRELAGGQLLLLSADKGYNHLHQLLVDSDPALVTHGGSFSFMVNYHAIRRFFERGGGFALQTSERAGTLELGAYWGAGSPADHSRSAQAFQDEIDSLSPADFSLLTQVFGEKEELSLTRCVALLRLSGWDPQLFFRLQETMLKQVGEASAWLKIQLGQAAEKIAENFFPIGDGQDVPFALGRLLHGAGRHRQALPHYQRSIETAGDHASTRYNRGLCYYCLGDLPAALAELDHSLTLDENSGKAREWRIRVAQEMAVLKAEPAAAPESAMLREEA